jgi:hypothetical protein
MLPETPGDNQPFVCSLIPPSSFLEALSSVRKGLILGHFTFSRPFLKMHKAFGVNMQALML